jgi:hypothetical protein
MLASQTVVTHRLAIDMMGRTKRAEFMVLAALVMSSHALHDGFEVLRWEDGGIGPGAAGPGEPPSLPHRVGREGAGFKKTPDHNWASHGADGWRCLSLSWRAPMREPEEKKVPIGLPPPDITMDQFVDIEDGWSAREDGV